MKKPFDCVEMKRKAQEEIYEETRGLSPEEELEYFHEAGKRFWREIERLREQAGNRNPIRSDEHA